MRRIGVVVGVLVVAQVLGGCFVLRETNWSTDKVKAGDATVATIGLQPLPGGPPFRGAGSEPDEYFFLYGAFESSEGLRLSKAKFDTGNVIGESQEMQRDAALEQEFMESGGNCGFFVPSARGGELPPGSPEAVFRTDPVETPANESKLMEASLRAKVEEGAPSGGAFGIILSGAWLDDGDGVPESDEDEIGCTGGTTTSLVIKGDGDPGEPISQSLRERLAD